MDDDNTKQFRDVHVLLCMANDRVKRDQLGHLDHQDLKEILDQRYGYHKCVSEQAMEHITFQGMLGPKGEEGRPGTIGRTGKAVKIMSQ